MERDRSSGKPFGSNRGGIRLSLAHKKNQAENKEKRMTYATLNFYPRKDPRMRFFALWYFTTLLILWTILGDTVLGFEQSYAQPIIGVLAACAVAFLLEGIDAWSNRR